MIGSKTCKAIYSGSFLVHVWSTATVQRCCKARVRPVCADLSAAAEPDFRRAWRQLPLDLCGDLAQMLRDVVAVVITICGMSKRS